MWLALGETASRSTLTGGIFILAALAMNGLLGVRRRVAPGLNREGRLTPPASGAFFSAGLSSDALPPSSNAFFAASPSG